MKRTFSSQENRLPLATVLVSLVVLVVAPVSKAQTTTANSASEAGAPISVQGAQPSAMTAAAGQLSPDTVISPDDVVELFVMDVPEFSRQYRISPTGKLTLPMLKTPITAAGLKVPELAATVANALRENGLVTNPYVTANIVSSRTQSVSITGAVKMPQIYPLFGRTTLLEMLSQAQGLAEDAGNVAIISRSNVGFAATGETSRTETVDLTKLMQSGDPALNPPIYPGDRVTVPRAGIVYVVGAVNKPGGFTIKQSTQGMTVLQALAFAGDAKSTAKRNKTMIIRPDPDAPGGHQQVPIDLAKVLSGKIEDPVLKPNDVLFVPDSEGKKALIKGLESALNAASMAVVYHPF